MLDDTQIAAASRTLHDHWRAGTKLAALESSQRPRDRAEGYAIQAALAAHSTGAPVRLEDRSHQRGRPEAHQCRRPDGRAHSERDRDCRWRHGLHGRQRDARRRTRIRLSHGCRSAAATGALHRAAGARRCRHAASGDRDSRFEVFGFRQRRRRANHRRQRLRPSVRARRARDVELARARPCRGEAGDQAARAAIHRPWQERARRSPDRAGMARQRASPARRDAESRRGRHHRHLPSAAADSIRRSGRGRFRCAGQGVG